MAEEAEKFPGEENEEEVRLPWFVATAVAGADGAFTPVEIKADNFKLQIEADKWIRENAEDGVVYGSFRRGKLFKVQTVRKIEEL